MLKMLAPNTDAEYVMPTDSTSSTPDATPTPTPTPSTTGLQLSAGSSFIDGHQLRTLLRSEYRAPANKKDTNATDKAFNMLRMLQSDTFRLPKSHTSTAYTKDVLVEVSAIYLPNHQKDDPLGQYFSYRVKIENLSDREVTLMGRYRLSSFVHLLLHTHTHHPLFVCVVTRPHPPFPPPQALDF
jgi:hypothetical protein